MRVRLARKFTGAVDVFRAGGIDYGAVVVVLHGLAAVNVQRHGFDVGRRYFVERVGEPVVVKPVGGRCGLRMGKM